MRRFAGSRAPSPTTAVLADLTWFSLLALVVVSISRVHQAVGIIGRLRPALLLFAVAFGGAMLQGLGRLRWTNLTRFWPGVVLVVLALLACLSAPFGISFGSSAAYILSNYGKTLLIAVMLIVCMRRWRDLSRLTWAYVIGVGLLAALSVFVYGISKTQSNDTFDANDVGLIMVTGVPLAVATLQTSRRTGKVVSGVILLLTVLTIAKSLSRGAFVGLLIVGVAIILSLRAASMGRRVAILAAVALTLVVAAPQGYWDMMRTLTKPTADYNWDAAGGRKAIAKRGIGYMMSYPLFGIGIHNFERAEGTISERVHTVAPGKGVKWAAPHNSYVEIGAELGIFGFLLYTSLVLGCIVAAWREHRRLPAAWRTGTPDQRFLHALTNALPIAMGGFAVTSFFVSFAYLDVPYVLVALTCGAHACVARRLPRAETVATVRSRVPVKAGGTRRLAPAYQRARV